MKKILSILAAVLLSLMVVVPIAAAGPSTKLERRVVPVSAIAATTSRVSAPAPTITRAPLRSLVPIRALVMAPTAPASASTDGVVFGSCEVTITSTENIDFITSTSSTNDGYTVTPIPNAEVNITITGDVNSVTLVTGPTETTHARPADITNSCPGTPNQSIFHN